MRKKNWRHLTRLTLFSSVTDVSTYHAQGRNPNLFRLCAFHNWVCNILSKQLVNLESSHPWFYLLCPAPYSIHQQVQLVQPSTVNLKIASSISITTTFMRHHRFSFTARKKDCKKYADFFLCAVISILPQILTILWSEEAWSEGTVPYSLL